jgi:tRNA threonylcarbamoyladenosine biosynthesis protein TsaE
MTQRQVWRIRTASAEATEELGETIGGRLRGGETIELVSDLGGGKTTFVRGLARGFGSTDKVSSPTFTISLSYEANGRLLHHFDFYRLQEAGIVANELAEVVCDPAASVVVEWGDIVASVLPKDRLTITIAAVSEQEREFIFTYPSLLAYLVPKEHA